MASVDRRRCDFCGCPACFHGSSGGAFVSGIEDPPASFVWSGKLLVLSDPGGEIASDREYESLSGIEKTGSSGGAKGGFQETVAENTSDGVIAPLLFLLIGGAPLGFAYKAVNTMDSMLGYKEETYLYIGRTAAKADDVVNYIPARISALLMIAGAFLCGMDGKQAWKIFRRDRRKHASPNSAQTESVCAGALGIQLAGDACYFGKRYKKETIGDPLRSVEAEDIKRAALLMYATEILTLFLFGSLRFLLCLI